MSTRVVALLAVIGLALASCRQAPIEAPNQTAVAQVVAEPAVASTNTPAVTQPPTAPAADQETPSTTGAAAEPQDPIAADPARPGYTLDGSPSLGNPNAPVVILDFSDFQ